MSTLEDAIHLALEAHHGQQDRVGAPYILHALRVMFGVAGNEAMTVAVLHDVVEDTSVTLEDLQIRGFSRQVVEAIDALSRREGESYEEFIERISHNPLAARVKLADLRDNMDLRRLSDVGADDVTRLRRYVKAWHKLNGSQSF